MGKIDTITKEYIENPVIFADAFNQFLYHGEQRIDPTQLTELDTTGIVVPYGADNAGVPEQKYRDVLKLLHTMTDGDAAYCVMGIENQDDIHYALPIRNGLYDFLHLSHQVCEAANSHKQAMKKKKPKQPGRQPKKKNRRKYLIPQRKSTSPSPISSPQLPVSLPNPLTTAREMT